MFDVEDETRKYTGLNVLVLSPTPTAPLDFGNRKRVDAVCQTLLNYGANIHFLYYPSESDWRSAKPKEAEEAMRTSWSSFYIVPVTVALHSAAANLDHGADDWWDPAIGDMLRWLFSVQKFDIFIVNYSWLSKALEFAPPNVLRILDTHDRFSERRALLEQFGIAPEFFHTTAAEEAKCLKRANVVWAIKEREAEYFRSITDIKVITMVHAEKVQWRCRPRRLHDRIRVGIFGARNNINRVNLQEFIDLASEFIERTLLPCDLFVAGSICDLLTDPGKTYIHLLGRVEHAYNLYDIVDVVAIPMRFSTGLKIKVGEALAYGLPVISHEHAFEGYAAAHEFHCLPDFLSIMKAVRTILNSEHEYRTLWHASAISLQRAHQSAHEAFVSTIASLDKPQPDGVLICISYKDLRRGSVAFEHALEAASYLRNLSQISFYISGVVHSHLSDLRMINELAKRGAVFSERRLSETHKTDGDHIVPLRPTAWKDVQEIRFAAVIVCCPQILERRWNSFYKSRCYFHLDLSRDQATDVREKLRSSPKKLRHVQLLSSTLLTARLETAELIGRTAHVVPILWEGVSGPISSFFRSRPKTGALIVISILPEQFIAPIVNYLVRRGECVFQIVVGDHYNFTPEHSTPHCVKVSDYIEWQINQSTAPERIIYDGTLAGMGIIAEIADLNDIFTLALFQTSMGPDEDMSLLTTLKKLRMCLDKCLSNCEEGSNARRVRSHAEDAGWTHIWSEISRDITERHSFQ